MTDRHRLFFRRVDRLRAWGFTSRQASALARAGYDVIGVAPVVP